MADKVRGATLTNKASLLGGEERFRPVPQVKFSLGSSSQREFSSASFYMFGNLLARWGSVTYCVPVGSRHGMSCPQKRDPAVGQPSGRASRCAHPGASWASSQAISEAISGSAAPRRSLPYSDGLSPLAFA